MGVQEIILFKGITIGKRQGGFSLGPRAASVGTQFQYSDLLSVFGMIWNTNAIIWEITSQIRVKLSQNWANTIFPSIFKHLDYIWTEEKKQIDKTQGIMTMLIIEQRSDQRVLIKAGRPWTTMQCLGVHKFLGVQHLIRSVKDLETVWQHSLDFLALIHSENQFKCGARARLTTNKTHTLNYITECLHM